jgi:YHS domain-containing protein/(2Fe-2S) ferredoxin
MNADAHGPNHAGTGCPTCDRQAGQPRAAGPLLATVKLTARGEEFRIVQLQGQLMVCARQHGSCCCGWDEKGRLPFDPQALWGEEWERRKIRNRVHLTFTGCLGPCAVGNNALLVLYGRSIWLKDLNRPDLASTVYDWIESMLAVGRILPPPDELKDHVYDRFLPPPVDGYEFWETTARSTVDGLDRLDPVCLMDVDPSTARHTVDYAGRLVAFCAPSCKKQFLADPSAYLTA